MKHFIFISLLLFSFTLHSQVIKPITVDSYNNDDTLSIPKEIFQQQFNFKGFSIVINDDASDEKGNHLLVGEIRAIEPEELKRDSTINFIFNLKRYSLDDPMGIIITTDKNYTTLQIAPSFVGEKVIYNIRKKEFTIGANFFDYLHVGDKSFSAWQPVIVQTNFQLKQNAYFILKEYSCILKDMIINENEITVFTRSDKTRVGDKDGEKAEVLTVSPLKFHFDSAKYRDVLDVISNLETPYNDIGRMTLSDVSFFDSTYYFTTSNLNQFALKSSNHLYAFKNKVLTEIPPFQDYIKWNNENSDWIIINDFFARPNNTYLFLTHQAATKKEITFSKTNTRFNALQSKKIPLNDYADFDKMLVLTNGNIVILSVSETKTWTYTLYNSDLQFIKEIDSMVSKDYYPTKLKETRGTYIECLFYIKNIYKKDCLLQTINLD